MSSTIQQTRDGELQYGRALKCGVNSRKKMVHANLDVHLHIVFVIIQTSASLLGKARYFKSSILVHTAIA